MDIFGSLGFYGGLGASMGLSTQRTDGRRGSDREVHVLGPPASVGARPAKKLVETPAPHPLVDWGVFPHRDQDKGDWKVADWAVEQLDGAVNEPFFLSVGFFLPHVPCYATQKWFDLYPENATELPTASTPPTATASAAPTCCRPHCTGWRKHVSC